MVNFLLGCSIFMESYPLGVLAENGIAAGEFYRHLSKMVVEGASKTTPALWLRGPTSTGKGVLLRGLCAVFGESQRVTSPTGRFGLTSLLSTPDARLIVLDEFRPASALSETQNSPVVEMTSSSRQQESFLPGSSCPL